jgi:hypothetical protein
MDCLNNTTTAAKAMFDDMSGLKIPDEICITICLHIPVAFIKHVDPSYQGPPPATPGEQTTLFYEIVRDTNSGSKLELLNEDRNFDITSRKDVTIFFQKIQTSAQQAERYMLFTWGHGAAISVFVSGNMQADSPKMLDMVELKEAILDTFSDKLKLVVMMDCFMQYIDTGLLLRQAQVEYMVAAQYGITFQGYNYKEIFGRLYSDPGISSRDLAKLCITTMRSLPNSKDSLVSAAIFATELSFYDDLMNTINTLGRQLSIEMDERPHMIHAAIKDEYYLNGAGKLMDLFAVIKNIANTLGGDWQAPTIKHLDSLHKRMFIEDITGPNVSFPRLEKALGLSVSIPKSKTNRFYNTFVKCNPGSISRIAGTCGDWTAFIDKYVAFASSKKFQTTTTIQ